MTMANDELREKKFYELTWRNKWLTAEADTIDDMIAAFQNTADEFREMKAAGVVLDNGDGSASNDYARLVLETTDPAVPERFGFEEQVCDDNPGEWSEADKAEFLRLQAELRRIRKGTSND